eukprot:gene13209-9055_t
MICLGACFNFARGCMLTLWICDVGALTSDVLQLTTGCLFTSSLCYVVWIKCGFYLVAMAYGAFCVFYRTVGIYGVFIYMLFVRITFFSLYCGSVIYWCKVFSSYVCLQGLAGCDLRIVLIISLQLSHDVMFVGLRGLLAASKTAWHGVVVNLDLSSLFIRVCDAVIFVVKYFIKFFLFFIAIIGCCVVGYVCDLVALRVLIGVALHLRAFVKELRDIVTLLVCIANKLGVSCTYR